MKKAKRPRWKVYSSQELNNPYLWIGHTDGKVLVASQIASLGDATLIEATPDLEEACTNLLASEGAWQDAVKDLNAMGKAAPAGIALAIEQARAALKKAYRFKL